MSAGQAAVQAYLAKKNELEALAAAAAAEAGVPICERCGKPCITGTNSMDNWGGPRCNDCASAR